MEPPSLPGNPPVLFEGAMGTSLMARGLRRGQPAESFTLHQPQVVEDIHQAFVAAGAKVLKTNTFNANRIRLETTELVGELRACNHQAVAIARHAARSDTRIAGSLGPTGTPVAERGREARHAAQRAYLEQAEYLEAAGVDLFLIETMVNLSEASIALAACRSVSTRPVIVTLTLSRGKRGFVTLAGDAAGDALRALMDAGASAVGSNCGLDSATMVPLARAMRHHLDAPLLLQPCAGQPHLTPRGWEYPEAAPVFAANLARIVEAGVEMVGGCCGATPAYLEAARRLLESGPSSNRS